MNLANWRHDTWITDQFAQSDLDEMAAGLGDLVRTDSAVTATWGMRQIAIRCWADQTRVA
jgi:hypothetical protein